MNTFTIENFIDKFTPDREKFTSHSPLHSPSPLFKNKEETTMIYVLLVIFLVILSYAIYLIITIGKDVEPIVLALAIIFLFMSPGPIVSITLLLVFKNLK